MQVSVGCDGKQCTSCAHCVATTVVSNAQDALWHERLRFGVVSAEELVTLRLLDWDTQYADKLLLSYSLEPPWPPSGALIEVRSNARFGEEPTRLFARLGYAPAATPEPQDGARLLHDGSERLVVTHLAEQVRARRRLGWLCVSRAPFAAPAGAARGVREGGRASESERARSPATHRPRRPRHAHRPCA